MKKHQKGFSLFETLLIIATIGLLSIVGWYVWQSRSNSGQKSEDPQTVQSNQDTAAAADASNTVTGSLPFTYSAPTGWDIQVFDESGYYSVTLTAPGTTTDASPYYKIITGAVVRLSCQKSAWTNLEQFKAENNLYLQAEDTNNDVTVNQTVAVQYTAGNEGPRQRITTFYVSEQECSIGMEHEVYKNTAHKAAYDQVVASIKF